MGKITIVEKKHFIVGQRKVEVQLQYEEGSDQPKQMQVVAKAKGIKMATTSSYSEETDNAACDYTEFDQAKAEKYIAGLLKFLDTKKGSALTDKEANQGSDERQFE